MMRARPQVPATAIRIVDIVEIGLCKGGSISGWILNTLSIRERRLPSHLCSFIKSTNPRRASRTNRVPLQIPLCVTEELVSVSHKERTY